jgi:hypothetical protein
MRNGVDDRDHEDSSAASTPSGEIECEKVDNKSSDEEIDEQVRVKIGVHLSRQ